jgi:predicted nucleic acid-binding protein
MPLSVVDTDMLSEVLKRGHATVRKKASVYLRQYGQFAFSSITRYEVVRGLKQKKAKAQLQRFGTFCRHALIFAITDDILDRAAELWVTAYEGGHSRNDADLIVAATALENGRALVTGNASHFTWIAGLTVEDWRQP